MTDLVAREKIMALENCMKQMPNQIGLPPTNYFAPGVYVRQVHMKAGSLFTSKIHKTEHIAIVSCGTADVYCDGEVKRIVGPCTFITQPGTKRALYIHEDMIWSTIHVTDKTDVDEIEKDIIAESFDALEGGGSCLGLASE